MEQPAVMLTDEQLQQVQEFFSSDAARVLFQQIEAQVLADWIMSDDAAARDECWHRLQAVLQLQASLRDASANKALSQRSQKIREVRSHS